MPRLIKPATAGAHGRLKRLPVQAATFATFSPGEPVPDADFIRLVVPGGTPDVEADMAEQLARATGRVVKVVREPAPALGRAEGEPTQGEAPTEPAPQRTLRQAVLDRAARATGVRHHEALLAALDEALTGAQL